MFIGAVFYSFGFSPYLLSPGVELITEKIKSTKGPIRGIKPKSNHQPLLLMSCNLLTVTAREGMMIIKEKSPDNMPIAWLV